MLSEILPSCVSVAETRHDLDIPLYPREQVAIANAVEKRQREFTSGRACARSALEQLDIAPQEIPPGIHGAPRWPTGVVGSITHCEAFRAAAVARTTQLSSVGIDAEPNCPLPAGVLADVALPQEIAMLNRLEGERQDVSWDRLLFCIKEAVYKTWFPLAERWLGFEDAVIAIDPATASFTARLVVSGPTIAGVELRGFSGAWLVRDGLVLAAIAHRITSS